MQSGRNAVGRTGLAKAMYTGKGGNIHRPVVGGNEAIPRDDRLGGKCQDSCLLYLLVNSCLL